MLQGFIDSVGRQRMHGWVRDSAHPAASISIVITANGRLLERTVANVYRADLTAAGFGHGKFGFDVTFNPPLSPAKSWLIHVRSELDGADIPGSPVRLQSSGEFDGTARLAFSAALDGFDGEAELDDRIAFLARERDRLLQRRADLRGRGPDRRRARVAGQPPPPRRVLVVDQRAPEPDRDGGSNALVSHMRSLQRLGFQVAFAAQEMAGGPAIQRLEALGIQCCHQPWYASVEEVLRREADTFDVVYLHRVAVASAYTVLARQTQRRTRLLFSVADLHHVRLARQGRFEDRPELLSEAERSWGLETWAAHQADAVITHSTMEAELLRAAVPGAAVHVVAWSVPLRSPALPFAKRAGMALIGNFTHAPNASAVRTLRDDIMPLLRRDDPAIVCQLVGDGLPPSLQPVEPGLTYAGPVASLDSVFDRVRLTVAPLQFGAGLKGKVMASLAAGIPCVCSPVAAEGMGLPPSLRDELVVPDTAAAVRAIRRLHNDKAYNTQLARHGRRFAGQAFSETTLDAAMRQVLGSAAPSGITTPLAKVEAGVGDR